MQIRMGLSLYTKCIIPKIIFINDDNKSHLIKSLGIVSVWTQWAICNWSSEEKFLTFHIVRAVFVLIGSPKAE